jgi:hypothetical protein
MQIVVFQAVACNNTAEYQCTGGDANSTFRVGLTQSVEAVLSSKMFVSMCKTM